jgi:hypothetical protein
VSTITTESFGSVHEILKGWTPEAHGVFTDNLTHARRQLAASFESASVAGGTDIFGALWRLKTLIDSDKQVSSGGTREIWIFSDMMNETPALMMPALIASGSRKCWNKLSLMVCSCHCVATKFMFAAYQCVVFHPKRGMR